MEAKRTNLDLDLYYAKEFADIDEVIRKRLSKKKDKGHCPPSRPAGNG